MKKFLTYGGGLIAALMFIPIFRDAAGGASFNPLTFLLWASLSLVLALTLRKEGYAWLLPAAWLFSDALVGVVLMTKFDQKITWSQHDIAVAVMVVICTVAWLTTKTWVSTVFCTTALMLAAIPQTVDIYHHPEHASTKVWAAYFVSNAMAFFGGKKWCVEDRLAAGASTVLCALMVFLSLR